MKFKTLGKWDNPAESRALIYFAQLLDELLFDYSLDTYKPPAMNTSLLAKEASTVKREIDKGNVHPANLKFVCEELCKSIQDDLVAQELLDIELSDIQSILMETKKQSDEKIINVLKLISRQLYLPTYKAQIETALEKEIVQNRDFSKLRSLTRNYVTTLINYGFSSRFIQDNVNSFFFYSKDRIAGNESIKDFVSFFKVEPSEYKLIYKGPAYLSDFSENTENFASNLRITNNFEAEQSLLERHKFDLDSQHVYVVLDRIKAFDIYSARFIGDKYLNLFQSLISLYHHKEKPLEQMQCLAINLDNGLAKKISRIIHPMHKGSDNKTLQASVKFKTLLTGFKFEKDSFNKFNRSVELHGLALRSYSLENQIINLWIALESLVPSESQSGSQIDRVINFLIPFLNLRYFSNLLERFYQDFWNWNKALHIQIFRGYEGENKAKHAAVFLISQSKEADRTRFESHLRDYHLLRDRYEHLRNVLSSPKELYKTIDRHSSRVEWQIRRIYRARNSVVHDGNTPSYCEILIENLHDYLDILLQSLISMLRTKELPKSLGEAGMMARIRYDGYMRELQKRNATFDNESIHKLIFSKSIF